MAPKQEQNNEIEVNISVVEMIGRLRLAFALGKEYVIDGSRFGKCSRVSRFPRREPHSCRSLGFSGWGIYNILFILLYVRDPLIH